MFLHDSGSRQVFLSDKYQELGNQERSRREALEASHESQLGRYVVLFLFQVDSHMISNCCSYRNELQDRIRRECALQVRAATCLLSFF